MNRPDPPKKKLTPLRAIRLKCLDCSGMSAKEVRLCPIQRCPLFEYRFGKNPRRAGQGNVQNLRRKTATEDAESTARASGGSEPVGSVPREKARVEWEETNSESTLAEGGQP
jgi:hypothetical protein